MTITDSTHIQSIEKIIANAVNYAKSKDAAMAIWRQPNGNEILLAVDFSGNTDCGEQPLENKEPAFIFAPFDADGKIHRIKANLHLKISNNTLHASETHLDEVAKSFLGCLQSDYKQHPEAELILPITDKDKENFVKLVEESVQTIQQTEIQKVVPSRKKQVNLSAPLNEGKNYLRLCEAYPTAFVSMVYTPDTGIWMGATPELLISVEGNIFKTVSLAGTQKYEDGTSISNVAWTQKEIEEQALVSRYIINCFKKIRLREFEELGPKTVIAGNLLHLKTEFKVDIKATDLPDLGEIMLKLLHPTSAICGMPLEPARQFLKDKENYDRQYFSGYLGPANISGDTYLYVNLRCMHVEDDRATFFAGAGVTEDSQPEKEWLETEIKMNTLLNIIK